MKDLIVYSMLLANNLMAQGFRMKHVEKNKKFEHKLVFFFAHDNGIEQAIEMALQPVKEDTN